MLASWRPLAISDNHWRTHAGLQRWLPNLYSPTDLDIGMNLYGKASWAPAEKWSKASPTENKKSSHESCTRDWRWDAMQSFVHVLYCASVLCMCCAYCLLSFLFLFFFLDSISLAGKRLCFCTCVILPTYSSWVVLGQRHCKLTRFIQMAIWWPFMRLFQFFLIKSVRTPELSWNFFLRLLIYCI